MQKLFPKHNQQFFLSRFITTSCVIRKAKAGRLSKFNNRLRNAIIRKVKENPKISRIKIAVNVKRYLNVKLSTKTVKF